jgi:UDP-2-acetamido-2-deoxy-ribo-hexuluronate aminotransferase
MNILFVDLKSQYRLLQEEILAGIERILEHGQFIMGPEIQELEQALARFVGVRHAVACSSGTDALLMALMAYDVGPGDAVFTTPFTFIATGEVIALLGAMPIFVDIDQCTFNIDPIKLKEAVSRIKKEAIYTPKVVIPVDLFGLPADYGRIMDIAGAYGVYVLEDAAQSFGGAYQGRRAGGLGQNWLQVSCL